MSNLLHNTEPCGTSTVAEPIDCDTPAFDNRSDMSPKTEASKRKKDKESPPERAQFRATLDRNQSVALLEALGRKLQKKRSTIAAFLITTIQGNKKMTAELVKFYRNEWPAIEPRKIDDAKLFNWPVEIDDELKRLSWEAIGTGNKSETLRVLVAFFAKHYDVALPK